MSSIRRPGMRLSALFTLLAASLACAACTAEGDDLDAGDEPIGEDDAALVGGTPTSARPEVGRLFLTIGQVSRDCTGTLVHPRYVLTAAQCVDYQTGPIYDGEFVIEPPSGGTTSYTVERAYTTSSGLGSTDVAIVRLASSVPPSEALPALVLEDWPAAGQTVSSFGYGCQHRQGPWDGGFKQFVTRTLGQTWNNLCAGDSGGPLVLGGELAEPAMFGFRFSKIFAVNSGYGDAGDFFGDATRHGNPMARAAAAFGGTEVSGETVGAQAKQWLQMPGVKVLAGDFDGNGLVDLAFTGVSGWGTVPVLFRGMYGAMALWGAPLNYGDPAIAGFASWAAQPGVRALTGDFDGDGNTDIALTGGSNWSTVPIAFSLGDGHWAVTNYYVGSFAGWASTAGAQVVAGDFDDDGRDDLAVTGPSGWQSVPVAFSLGNGSFSVTNGAIGGGWTQMAATFGARAVAGDFDGDGKADIALTGPSGWQSVPVASSLGDGTFAVTNDYLRHFPAWASGADKVAVADFDGDGDDDIAATGGPGWRSIVFAMSSGGGVFKPANLPVQSFSDDARDAVAMVAGLAIGDSGADLIALDAASGIATVADLRP